MKKNYCIVIVMLCGLTTPVFAQNDETTLKPIAYPCQTNEFAKQAHLITVSDFANVLDWVSRVHGNFSPQMDSITPDPKIWNKTYGFRFNNKKAFLHFLLVNKNLPVKGIRACNIPFFIRSYNSFIRETFGDTNTYRLATKTDYNSIYTDETFVFSIMTPEIFAMKPGLTNNQASFIEEHKLPSTSSFDIRKEKSGKYHFRVVLVK